MKQSEIEEIKEIYINGIDCLYTEGYFTHAEYKNAAGLLVKALATERRKAVEEFVAFACEETYEEEKYFKCPECEYETDCWHDDDVVYCSFDRRRLKLATRNKMEWDNDNVTKREIKEKAETYLKESEAKNE